MSNYFLHKYYFYEMISKKFYFVLKKYYVHLFLCSVLIIFGYLTHQKITYVGFSEYGILECAQALILLACLIFNIKSKSIYYQYSNRIIFNLRNLFFSFILFEELSFLTLVFKDNVFNRNKEWNIHNSNIFYHRVFANIEKSF